MRKGWSRLFACERRSDAQREAPGYPEDFRDAEGRIAIAVAIDIGPYLVESVESIRPVDVGCWGVVDVGVEMQT